MSSESQALGRGLSFFEIETQLAEALDNGESEAVVHAYLEAAPEKRDKVAWAIKFLEKRIEFKRQEARELYESAQIDENQLSRLKGDIICASTLTDQKRFNGRIRTICVEGNGGKKPLDVYDPSVVPDTYKDTEILITPNSDRIRAALDAGEEVPGARLKPRGVHVTVR